MTADLTFVGTATTVLRLGAFTLLTDPNLVRRGQRVHLGYGLTSKRRTDPALTPAQLPAYDALVLSHLHGDHFDRVARRELPRQPPVVTTERAAETLRKRGFAGATGLCHWAAWETVRDDERLRITAVPGQHGPAGVRRADPAAHRHPRPPRRLRRLHQPAVETSSPRCGGAVTRRASGPSAAARPWTCFLADLFPDPHAG